MCQRILLFTTLGFFALGARAVSPDEGTARFRVESAPAAPAANATATTTTAPDGSLIGGTFRLDPLLPAGGGRSISATLDLTATIGQPTVAISNGPPDALRAGFWAPSNALAVDTVFRDGFE